MAVHPVVLSAALRPAHPLFPAVPHPVPAQALSVRRNVTDTARLTPYTPLLTSLGAGSRTAAGLHPVLAALIPRPTALSAETHQVHRWRQARPAAHPRD